MLDSRSPPAVSCHDVNHMDHALPTPPSACFGTHPKHRTTHPGSQAGGADWGAGAGGAARATPLSPVAEPSCDGWEALLAPAAPWRLLLLRAWLGKGRGRGRVTGRVGVKVGSVVRFWVGLGFELGLGLGLGVGSGGGE